MTRKSNILSDHEKIGKMFYPPLLSGEMKNTMKNISRFKTIMPELVWIGIIIERIGFNRSINLILSTVLAIKKILEPYELRKIGCINTYYSLSDNQFSFIRHRLKGKRYFNEIRIKGRIREM